MNSIHIAGHLGADPEVRFTSSGQKVTTLRVATRCRRTGSEDNTIWWRVTIWGEQFDKMLAYLKKGSAIIIVGELNKPEIFTDREGKPQISMSITASNLMFSPFGRGDRTQEVATEDRQEPVQPSTESPFAGFTAGQQPTEEKESFPYPSDDEIPF